MQNLCGFWFLSSHNAHNIYRSQKAFVRFDHSLNDVAVTTLVNYELRDRFPRECETWETRLSALRAAHQSSIADGDRVAQDLIAQHERLEVILRQAIVDHVCGKFPYELYFVVITNAVDVLVSRMLDREALQAKGPDEGDDVTGESNVYTLTVVSMIHADFQEYLAQLTLLYPQLDGELKKDIRGANLNKIRSTEFQTKKRCVVTVNIYLTSKISAFWRS